MTRRRVHRLRKDARLTRQQVRAAHKLHVEAGYSINRLGLLLWEKYGYSSPKSCACALGNLFIRYGHQARDRAEAVALVSTIHGKSKGRKRRSRASTTASPARLLSLSPTKELGSSVADSQS